MSVDAGRFLKQHTATPVMAPVVGPLTAAFYLKDEFYHDNYAVARALAAALNQQLRALDAVGVDLLVIPAERLHLAPDCGMWHLPRAPFVVLAKWPLFAAIRRSDGIVLVSQRFAPGCLLFWPGA
ncbi:hypothetical protein HC891_06455 [Candidatus Gracilibacteria bacterium]|nr:hypothetical protein [Candidatus Gracilibacteria bacterium]